MEALKKERKTLKGRFTRKVSLFEKSVNDKVHINVLSDLIDEINNIFSELEIIHDKLIDLTEGDDAIDVLNIYIDDVESKKIEVNDKFSSLKDTNANANQTADNIKFCVKKLSSPFFDGDRRVFPSFKSDFIRLTEARYGKDPFVLKSALSPDVLKNFNWIDNYDIMWDKLDQEYGSAAKIVDYVITDIKNLRAVPEGNNPKLLEVINCVEKGWYDLKRLGKEKEIENVTVITQIEKLLPPSVMRDWAVKRQSVRDESLFAEFYKFLLNEKKVIQYTEERIRKNISCKGINNVLHSNYSEENKETDSEYLKFMKGFQESQKQINETLSNLTLAFNNLAKIPNQSPNSNSTGAGSRWCFLHQSPTHDINNCINIIKYG